MQRHLLRASWVLAAGVATGMLALPAGADGERSAESGPRSVRFKGTVKAVDLRAGRFLVPVRQGRDGDPAPRTTDVLVITAGGTRFVTPPVEGRAAAPVRFQDLAPGSLVNVSGMVGRDGSVLAQEVTLFRKNAGAETEGGRRNSPEAEAAPRTGPRDGDTPRTGPRDGDTPRTGPRDGDVPRTGPRDGDAPRTGPRDTAQAGAEAQAAGWLAGRVKAIDAQRGTFLFEWRLTEGGALRTVRGIVAVSPTTRLSAAAARRDGEGTTPLTFRDLQVGGIVHVRGAETPNGLAAAEIRVFPLKGGVRRPEAGREGGGRRPEGEGRRSPEAER